MSLPGAPDGNGPPPLPPRSPRPLVNTAPGQHYDLSSQPGSAPPYGYHQPVGPPPRHDQTYLYGHHQISSPDAYAAPPPIPSRPQISTSHSHSPAWSSSTQQPPPSNNSGNQGLADSYHPPALPPNEPLESPNGPPKLPPRRSDQTSTSISGRSAYQHLPSPNATSPYSPSNSNRDYEPESVDALLSETLAQYQGYQPRHHPTPPAANSGRIPVPANQVHHLGNDIRSCTDSDATFIDIDTSFQALSLQSEHEIFTHPAKPTSLETEVSPAAAGRYAPALGNTDNSSTSKDDQDPRRAKRTAPVLSTCLDVPMLFPAMWHWHPEAPDFFVCSRCYTDSIQNSIFASAYQSRYCDDDTPRYCRFSKPRMKDVLFPQALRSGSLHVALQWMQLRATIPDCKGLDGAKGDQGIKWYKPRDDQPAGFVVCQACYEDRIQTQHLASVFVPVPEGLHLKGDTWACDLSIPYLQKLYPEKGKANDWASFVAEAQARMRFAPCPGQKAVSTYHKAWFVPKAGPPELIICVACYCDQVLLSGQEDKWHEATRLKSATGMRKRCALSQISIRMSMAQAHEVDEFSIFWTAIKRLSGSPACDPKGIKNGEWYTLPSDPDSFGICKACYVGIAEPLNIAPLLKRKTNIPPGEALLCCLNAAHPRFGTFFGKTLETYFTRSIDSFDSYASTWASIPTCKRDVDLKGGYWHGWIDCTICRECHRGFASKFPNMVSQMQLNNTKLEDTTMCEMYSPRMRKLFEKCAATGDIKPLLEFSAKRRMVYVQTVPQMRMMLVQAKFNLGRQQIANAMSTHYMTMGWQQQIMYGDGSYTYSAAGVGNGFTNMDMLQSAQYRQEAFGLMAGQQGATMQVGVLEQRWQAVE